MSASERLRALNSRLLRPWPGGQDPFIELGVALPLIADVAARAEELAAWWPNEAHGEISGEQFAPLRDALAALREHLEGQ